MINVNECKIVKKAEAGSAKQFFTLVSLSSDHKTR